MFRSEGPSSGEAVEIAKIIMDGIVMITLIKVNIFFIF